MKKVLKIAGIPVAAVCLLLLVWAVRGRPFTSFFYQFYPFGHEKCTVQLTVDGQATPLTEDMVAAGKFKSSGEENTVRSVKKTDDGGVIRCSGGVSGSQPFLIYVRTSDGRNTTFRIEPVVANSWEITEINLELSVDSGAHIYTATYRYEMSDGEHKGSISGAIADQNVLYLSDI